MGYFDRDSCGLTQIRLRRFLLASDAVGGLGWVCLTGVIRASAQSLI
jgi:hypothetical protein